MEVLCEWVMWNLISVSLEIVSVASHQGVPLSASKIGVRFVPNVPYARKSSWTHSMEVLGEWVMWNLVLVSLKIVLVSVQYMFMIWAKHTIGPEIVLDAPDGTLR
jgi:hypothetical protein